jgi:branched-subunit amino acid transport protein
MPLLAVERRALSERGADLLRHAGTGAIATLVVLAVLGPTGEGTLDGAVLVAVTVSGLLAWRGHSTLLVMLAGGAAFALATALGTLF